MARHTFVLKYQFFAQLQVSTFEYFRLGLSQRCQTTDQQQEHTWPQIFHAINPIYRCVCLA
jgi:hypothetical protein